MGGKSVNGWRFWSLEGDAPEAPAKGAESKTKKAGKTKRLISKVPNHKGDPAGKSRYWCTACTGSFLVEDGSRPEVCPEGHRADDPELTAPAGVTADAEGASA